MKITLKKSFAVIMALVMCVSVLFGVNLSVFAADTNTVTYVKDGSYVYNWGQRGETATFLSPMAEEFYKNKNVSLKALLDLDGSSNTSNVPDSALYDALYNLMATTKNTSYDDTRDLFKYTDCQNSGGSISSFYSGKAIGPDWDQGSTWNREHIWPNSKSNGGSNTNTLRETDIMMLRPASVKENSSRGNNAYGESSNFYNPNSESGGVYDLRGDVARIVLYVYVRWGGDTQYHDGALDYMWGSSGVIESKEVLINWIEADPVDTWEMGRNDSTEAILGTRNVFVDYPELAFDLFNESVPTNYTSPSDGTSVEGTTGTGGADSDYEIAAEATITFDDTAKRTTFGDAQQIWEENGITFTNNKSNSTSKVADYSNPVRVYKNSEVVINYDKAIAKITFATSSAEYATALESSLSGLGTITTSGNNVTLVLSQPTKTFTFANSGGATRFNSITVYATDEVVEPDPEEPTPDPDPEEPTPDTPDEPITGTPTDVTINFGDVANRTTTDADKHVWTENGVTVTNSKGSNLYTGSTTTSTRFYNQNQITTEYDHYITKMVFATTSTNYAGLLENSLKASGLGTVTTDSTSVTVELTTPSKTVSFTHIENVVYVKTLTITALIDDSETTYIVTAQPNNEKYGTVTVTTNMYIEATPKSGYEIDSSNPYTIISGTATVTPSGNKFAVTAEADVTIQINFKERAKGLVNYYQCGKSVFDEEIYIGDKISTLPDHFGNVPLGWTFAGWTTTEISGETTTKPTVLESNYAINGDITFYAIYTRSEETEVEGEQTAGAEITFNLGANGSATHKDNNTAQTTYTETVNGYKLDLQNGNKCYPGSLDAKGNSAIKIGSSSAVGSFKIANIPNDVTKVIFMVAKYKDKTSKINVNGTAYTLTKNSNDGAYDAIEVDTSSTKTITFTTVSGAVRCMINSIIFVTEGTSSGPTIVTTSYYTTNPAFTDNETQGYYVKVTEDQTDWSGEYLVVFEGNDKKADAVFDGSRPTFDEAHNVLSGVSANGGAIKAKQSIDAAIITIEKSGDKYLIKANGKYIAPTSGANGITADTEDLHTITFTEGKVEIVGSTGSYLRFNSDNGKNNYRFRYYQASSYQNQGAITLYKRNKDLEATITGAQITVGADLSMKYSTEIEGVENTDENELSMRYTIADSIVSTASATIVDGDYVFVCVGISPQHMGDNIKAELLLNGGVLAVYDNYSVKQNVINLLNQNPSDELKQFISDMLYYGAAAQQYTNYKTETPVTDGIDGLLPPSEFDWDDNDKTKLTSTSDATDDGPLFRAASVWFDNQNGIIVKLKKTTENTTLKVNGVEVELNGLEYKVNGIKVTDYSTVYTFELYENGVLIQTLEYSINSYAYSQKDSTKPAMKALATALYRLGKTAEEL